MKIGWCDEHEHLAWRYDDGSIGCAGALIIETSTSNCSWRRVRSLRELERLMGDET